MIANKYEMNHSEWLWMIENYAIRNKGHMQWELITMDCPEYSWKISSWHPASIDRSHFHVHMVRVASRSAIAFIEFVNIWSHSASQCWQKPRLSAHWECIFSELSGAFKQPWLDSLLLFVHLKGQKSNSNGALICCDAFFPIFPTLKLKHWPVCIALRACTKLHEALEVLNAQFRDRDSSCAMWIIVEHTQHQHAITRL